MSDSDLLGGFEEGGLFGSGDESDGGVDMFGASEASNEPPPTLDEPPYAPEARTAAKPQNTGYLVLARKYRPQTFDQIVGQEGPQQALRGAIATGNVSHAYLFSGPRGTGKTSTARILAKALNCQDGGPRPDPCGKCASCRSIAAGSSLDVIEIDAASNTGVDNIRELRSGVVLAPFSRYKVYIVDEVHMLSNQAFNALLKTLEEPPPQVIFVLATTELQKVPETVVSRCQAFTFRRFRLEELKHQLGKILDTEVKLRGLSITDEDREKVLDLVARSAEGGMRDAQVTLDQVLVLSREKIDFEQIRRFLGMADTEILDEFVDLLHRRDARTLLELIDNLAADGQDLELLVKNICDYLRDLLMIRVTGLQSRTTLVNLSDDRYDALKDRAQKMGGAFLLGSANVFLDLANQMKTSSQPRFTLELAVFRLTSLDSAADVEVLVEKIKNLESQVQTGIGTAAAANAVVQKTGNADRMQNNPSVSRDATSIGESPSKVYAAAPEISLEAERSFETTSHVKTAQRQDDKAPAAEYASPEFMERLILALEGSAHMLAISMRECARVVSYDARSAVIGVNAAEPFVAKQLTSPQNLAKIKACAAEIHGPLFQIRMDLLENWGTAQPANPQTSAKPMESDAIRSKVTERNAPAPVVQPTAATGSAETESFARMADSATSSDLDSTGDDEPLTVYYPPELIEKSMRTLSRKDFHERLEKKPSLREIVEKAMQAFGIDDARFELRIRTL